MSCLYLAAGRVQTWQLCKLGISTGAALRRGMAHVRGRYTSYGVEVHNWAILSAFNFSDIVAARAAETLIKRHVLATYPRVASDVPPRETSVPLWTRVHSKPSGEWLVTPGNAATVLRQVVRDALGGP